MREALAARSGRDFVVTAPLALAAAAGSGCGRLARATLRLLVRHPTTALALALVATGLGFVAMNALVSQPRRHPAPLFAPKVADKAMAPLPPSRPLAVAPIAATPPAPASVAAPPAVPAPTPAPRVAPIRDPIADVIRSGEAGASAGKADAAKIAAAQRALNKLGYGPLKADGMAGAGTHQAIERFERERRIPVTGELNPRTLKELSTRSGMPIG